MHAQILERTTKGGHGWDHIVYSDRSALCIVWEKNLVGGAWGCPVVSSWPSLKSEECTGFDTTAAGGTIWHV